MSRLFALERVCQGTSHKGRSGSGGLFQTGQFDGGLVGLDDLSMLIQIFATN